MPGQIGAEEMKFLNTNTYSYHYKFASEAVHIGISLAEFNTRTYFRDDRSNLAGTIIAHDRFVPAPGSAEGLYALEFWPTDPVRARHVTAAFELVKAAMAFAGEQLAYHPAGDTQEAFLREDEAALRDAGVRVVKTSELFASVSYVALNLGEGYGVLSAVDPTTGRPPSIRCRSSTNNEDLAGFNGAGLYDSFTHRPDEGKLGKTVRQVWASLWNLRAFDERDFHRIDHLSAAMGVLVHANFDDELANGVAVTKNPYDPQWPGFYVNVPVGESLVTNPDSNPTPDELLISAIGPQDEYETQHIRRSTLTAAGAPVLTAQQIERLTGVLETIQERFKIIYGAQADPAFAMDVEFKIDAAGDLAVKQARPWVD